MGVLNHTKYHDYTGWASSIAQGVKMRRCGAYELSGVNLMEFYRWFNWVE